MTSSDKEQIVTALSPLIREAKDLGDLEVFDFKEGDGLTLKCYAWLLQQPKGFAFLVHGLTSHALGGFLAHNYGSDPSKLTPATILDQAHFTYKDSFVERLNKSGFSVLSYDQQGHGFSDCWKKSRCNVQSFHDLPSDLLQVVHHCHTTYNDKGLPIYLIGISLGAAVVLRALQLWKWIIQQEKLPKTRFIQSLQTLEGVTTPSTFFPLSVEQCKELPIKGAVVFCPAISTENVLKKTSHRFMLPFSGLFSTLVPTMRVATLDKNVKFEWIEYLREKDPISYKEALPVRLLTEVLSVGQIILKDSDFLGDAVGSKPISLYLLHSKLDTLCDLKGTMDLHGLIHKDMDDIHMTVVATMWHFLLTEPNTEDLQDRVCEWLVPRL